MRSVDLESGIDIVFGLLENDSVRAANRLRHEMSALLVVDRECNLAVGRLELNTTQRAVAMPRFDAFVEKLLETIDTHEPAFVLAVERFENSCHS